MHPAQRDRERDKRLRRFGIIAGLLLALFFHLILFWGPRVHYRPVLEQAKIKRVIVARPYQPKPQPPPPPKRQASKQAAAAQPTKSAAPAQSPVKEVVNAKKPVKAKPKPPLVNVGGRGKKKPDEKPVNNAPSEWEQLMSELAQEQAGRGEGGSGKEWDVAQGAGGEGGEGGQAGAGDALLDPRIRVKVVSYPPTSIESYYPGIPFPNVRVTKKQMQKGICRVWYRVWTNERGDVVRDQVKTPSDPQELREYQAYVDMVVEEVNAWPFDRVKAEIHVDVLFDLKNLD